MDKMEKVCADIAFCADPVGVGVRATTYLQDIS